MGFADAVKYCLGNLTNFNGRAARSEFWWYILAISIANFAISFVAGIIHLPISSTIATFAMIALIIAAAARRMHDNDKSGWFQLIPFYSLYLAIIKGTDGPNSFGEDPLG